MDKMVYKFYGLTKEEVVIVENSIHKKRDGNNKMIRTFIQVLSLLLTFVSAIFLVKSIVGMSVQDMAEQAKGYIDQCL